MSTLILAADTTESLAELERVAEGASIIVVTGPFEEALRFLQTGARFERVYTHSPLDPDPRRHDLALLAAKTFGEIWVPKEDRFVRARFSDVARTIALTHYDRVPSAVPDCWAFESSPYEKARFDATSKLLALVRAPSTVLELGACEGLMTERIRRLFPGSRITAVEPEPSFRARLLARFASDENLDVIESAIEHSPLSADLIVATEVLYYVADRLDEITARLDAGHLVTSYHGDFDRDLFRRLLALGWTEVQQIEIAPVIERAGDGDCPFLIQRVGCTIRLWSRYSQANLEASAGSLTVDS